MYDNALYEYRPQHDSIVSDLTKAINGEYSAIHCYERLAQLAPTDEQRHRILEIRQDEINHFHRFSQLYTQLTNRQPTPQITEECPAHYRDGLTFAFNDEQNTVDFYLKAADRASQPLVQEAFRRAAARCLVSLFFDENVKRIAKRKRLNRCDACV
ncbi:hypothetical protein J1TS1_01070 [Shouchella clausii]|nr:hypothetical protein J1TS1_01070 [Shouchella clausii]